MTSPNIMSRPLDESDNRASTKARARVIKNDSWPAAAAAAAAAGGTSESASHVVGTLSSAGSDTGELAAGRLRARGRAPVAGLATMIRMSQSFRFCPGGHGFTPKSPPLRSHL